MTGGAVTFVEGRIESGRIPLHYRGWEAAAPSAILLIAHGLAEHGGRYEATGRALAAGGVSTWALDQRGHGRSGGQRGHAGRFDVFLEDLDRFRTSVRDRSDPAAPLFLLGHSMGGLVVLRYLEEHPGACRGAVVVSPWLGTAVAVPEWKTALAAVLTRVAPALPFRAGIPAESLSHDPAVVAAYRTDPLVHDIITPRLFSEVRTAMARAFERADRIRDPVLFLLAGSDRIVDTGRSRAFTQRVRGAEVEVLVQDGAYHELLNEPEAGRYVMRILDWIGSRAVAGPA